MPATIGSNLSISQGNTNYQSRPQSFTADISGLAGPTPGAISAATSFTIVSLTQITSAGGVPGLCRIMNLDQTNFVEVGIYDSGHSSFYPLMELLPGETYVFRLSRYLGEEMDTTPGTGTSSTATVSLAIKADVAACQVLVEAFAA
jgi:hypothetical protein